MEIELPDGTILEAPDDANPSVVAKSFLRNQRIEKLKQDNPGEYDSNSPEWQAKYGATSGMSGWDKFMAGAGKSVVDLGRGIRQVGAEAFGGGDDLRAQQDENARLDAPLMHTGAGVSGNIAGTLASFLIPGTVAARAAQGVNMTRTAMLAQALSNPTTYRAAAASGALMGALQPVGTDDSRTFNTALGGAAGAAGMAAANTIGRVAQPIKRALTPQDARAVTVLKGAGVPLDAAQRSGSKAAQVVKRAIGDNPLTSSGQAAFQEKQMRGFTRAVLRNIGVNADSADEAAMGAAKAKIGREFNDVLSQNSVRISNGFKNRVAQVVQSAKRQIADGRIAQTVDDILKHANDNGGRIDGKFYNNLRGELTQLESEKGIAPLARELRELLDNSFTQAAKPGDAKRLVEARRLWRNMKVIENAIDAEGNGMISPSKLANQFATKRNRSVGVYGQGDQSIVALSRLAKAGKRLIPDKFPNSGTASRIAGQLALPALVGGAQGVREGDVGAGLKAGVLTAGALYGARGAMNNQLISKYLTEGIGSAGARNALMAPRRVLPLALPALQE